MAEQTVRIEGTVPITGTVSVVPSGSTSAVTTLSAATTGTGTPVDFVTAANDISMAVLVNGTVTGGSIALDVSHDGTNWVQFSTMTPVTNVNNKLTSSNEAWRYARGRVATNITGGATITCTIMKWG